jgi:serine/threonine-protein kinase
VPAGAGRAGAGRAGAGWAGLGWIAAAVVATLIGLGGIRLIGDSLTSTPGGVLDGADVARALTASPSTGASATPAGTASATPTGAVSATPTGAPSAGPAGPERGFSSAGGTVVAGCRDGRPYLVSWSPSPGYSVTRHEAESEHADVRFEGPAGRSEIRVACSGNAPVEQNRDR